MAEDTHGLADSGLEPVESEEQDLDSSPARFELITYPADYTLEGLVRKHEKGQLKIPGFQRRFVWSLPQASKLIESFLLGLPVPAIFLYADPSDDKLSVIDGQQRLLSVVYYFEGYFGPPEKGRRQVFALKGLNEKSPYNNLTYGELPEGEKRKLEDAVLRAFVIKQLHPRGDGSIYHVFERLNTGGTQLVSQEIRNCIYHGPFNDMLGRLNGLGAWREVFGAPQPDKRQRDVELILRFLALHFAADQYKKPMKDFLSSFMDLHRFPDPAEVEAFEKTFRETIQAVRGCLGERPFHVRAGLNAAVFDSVTVAIARHRDSVDAATAERYQALVQDEAYQQTITSGTTDEEVVARRLQTAERVLFG